MPFGFGRGGGKGQRGRGGKKMGRVKPGRGKMFNVPQNCICPQCNTVLPHQRRVPCFQTHCPNCGSLMTRQFNVPDSFTSPQTREGIKKPVVNPEPCNGCAKCVAVCSVNAIEMINNKAVIHPEICNNCRACIPACSFSAIK